MVLTPHAQYVLDIALRAGMTINSVREVVQRAPTGASAIPIDAFLSDLATLGGYVLTDVRAWETSFGRFGSALGVDATYTRVVDGTVRAVCKVRVLGRRFSYGLNKVVDDGTVTAEFGSVHGSAIITDRTTFPVFVGVALA